MCYNDRVYLSNIVPSVVDVFCSAIGRYVIYYNERFSDLTYPYGYSKFAFVDLCEVEVYGNTRFVEWFVFLKCEHRFSNASYIQHNSRLYLLIIKWKKSHTVNVHFSLFTLKKRNITTWSSVESGLTKCYKDILTFLCLNIVGCPVLEYGFENSKCTVPCAAMCKSRKCSWDFISLCWILETIHRKNISSSAKKKTKTKETKNKKKKQN